ncbi:putative receptor-like protein [Drosera capensis]
MTTQSLLSAELSKKTILGLKLWILIGLGVGAFIVLILLILSLWLTFRRKSKTTLDQFPPSQIPNISKDIKIDRAALQHPHEDHDNLILNVHQKLSDRNSEKLLVHLGMSKSSDPETLSQCSSIYHHERAYSSQSGEEGSSGTIRKQSSFPNVLPSASPLVGLPEISHLGWGHWFTLRDLEIATNRFSAQNIIGEGGYGVVYRGKLVNGAEVAVKRLLNNLGQAEKEFRVEVEAIGHARHKNLVRLLGYCIEGVHSLFPISILLHTYVVRELVHVGQGRCSVPLVKSPLTMVFFLYHISLEFFSAHPKFEFRRLSTWYQLPSKEQSLVGLFDRMLVYEYVSNGNLEQWLHGSMRQHGILTWEARMKVLVGTAKALAYLHESIEPKVVHRDIKSSNILIDEEFNGKVSDFGLAKLLDSRESHINTRVMGTFGYVAPEYANSGLLNEKSDIYSFGVLVLESITGREPVDYARPPSEVNLVEWLKQMVGARRAEEVVDPALEARPSTRALKRALLVALKCIDPDPEKRPKMGQVVRMLEVDEFPQREDRRNRRARTGSVEIDPAKGKTNFSDAGSQLGETDSNFDNASIH